VKLTGSSTHQYDWDEIALGTSAVYDDVVDESPVSGARRNREEIGLPSMPAGLTR
jgi:hypothetical protein